MKTKEECRKYITKLQSTNHKIIKIKEEVSDLPYIINGHKNSSSMFAKLNKKKKFGIGLLIALSVIVTLPVVYFLASIAAVAAPFMPLILLGVVALGLGLLIGYIFTSVIVHRQRQLYVKDKSVLKEKCYSLTKNLAQLVVIVNDISEDIHTSYLKNKKEIIHSKGTSFFKTQKELSKEEIEEYRLTSKKEI